MIDMCVILSIPCVKWQKHLHFSAKNENNLKRISPGCNSSSKNALFIFGEAFILRYIQIFCEDLYLSINRFLPSVVTALPSGISDKKSIAYYQSNELSFH